MKIFKNKNLQKSTGGGRIEHPSYSLLEGKVNIPLAPFQKGEPKKAPSRRGWGCPAFTLVELIVVITILAILSTIWFVAYSWYLAWTRDTNRISQLKSISDWLEMYRTKHDLPMPDDYVEITASWETIAYQWYLWKNVLETIEYTSEWKDPKDWTYFSYYLTKDKKYYQLMAYLEEADNLQSFAPPSPPLKGGTIKVSAIDYTTRYPTVYWKKLGILTDENNTPIQELEEIKTNWLDIVNTTNTYIARFKDNEKIEWTWAILAQINPKASCKRIKELKGSSQDWVYEISPEWWNKKFKVYCDMTTDWGGWTLVLKAYNWDDKHFYNTDNNKILENNDVINDISTNLTKEDYKWKWYFEIIWSDLLAVDLSDKNKFTYWYINNWKKTLKNHILDAQDWRWEWWENWCWIMLDNLKKSSWDVEIWNIPVEHFWLMCTDDRKTWPWSSHWDDSVYFGFLPRAAHWDLSDYHHSWIWKWASDWWNDVYESSNWEYSSDSWIAIFIR